ncbi:A-kinase anchor protein 13-like [Stegostoma tigrinum]|uniref:A-kinase anchor protein 13-like n=1 Tax=Stegostoma tigrinum TaxID=3053191 RepID=UPI00287028DC|nr:A-kinase anchor protein 13-like [Stegostoma tigrinum]
MLQKVNRKLLSRCRWLGRSNTPAQPDHRAAQTQCKPEGSQPPDAKPSHPDITSGASAAGNVVGEDKEEDIGARVDIPGEGMTSDPEHWGPMERDDPSYAWEEEGGEEKECRVTLRPGRKGRCSWHSESPVRPHSWEPGNRHFLGLGSSQGYSVSLGNLQDEELEVSAVGPAGQARIYSCAELSLREEEETDPVGISGHFIKGRRAGFMSRIGEILDEGAQPGLQIQHQTTSLSPDPEDGNIRDNTSKHDLHTETGGKVHRTVSFLKKMAGITKTKEKVREREKEARERETRITNGHLFNTITVSGNTLCYACNKSIITREAFACPNCNVTIHKSCKDALASCTKVKQKVRL